MKPIVELMEREGGHIAVLLLLFFVLLYAMILYPDLKLIHDFANMVLGALLFCMKGVGNNQPPIKPA